MFVNLFILPLQFFKKKSASFLVLNLPLMVLWYQSFLKRTLQSLEPSLSKSLPLKMAVFMLITDDVLSLEKWTTIQELIVSQEFAWHKQDEMLSSLSIFILILLYFIKKLPTVNYWEVLNMFLSLFWNLGKQDWSWECIK